MHLSATRQTEIQIFHAAPGTWTIDNAPGTPPITSAATSHDLGASTVTGRVTGSGGERVLHYTIRNIAAGTSVTFVERGTNGGKLLGRARGSRGSLRFTPSDATGQSRTIVADLVRADGSALPTITVAHYRAAPGGPGRPAHVRVRRTGTSLQVTFSPSAGAAQQIVIVRLSDRVSESFVLGPRARRLIVRGVPRGVRATSIVILGRSALGIPGPAARGSGG